MAAVIGLSIPASATAQKRRSTRTWWLSYLGVLGLTAVVAALAFFTAPKPLAPVMLALVVLVIVAIARPELGLLFIAFFAVAGDSVTVAWYPFNQGLSAKQSVLFVSNAFQLSPLELMLLATTLGWIWRMAATRQWAFRKGVLYRPIMAFTAFVFFGLAHGIATGGDRYVALWEVRPILAMVVIYVLATNLYTRPENYRRLWSALMLAVVVDSVDAIVYYHSLSAAARAGTDSLGEHAAALHANVFFVLMMALGVVGARSTRRLVVMLLATPIVGYAYILAERRAAFVGLVVATMALLVLLHVRRRRAFWYIVPVFVLIFGGYLGAFWNSTSSAAFPAQAVKTMISPGSVSKRDQSSDYYRLVEDSNVVYSIRVSRLTGLGFGQQYLRPYNNADITFSQWWQYRPHNAILWIWIQMGVGGFIAMLYLFASAIRHGTRAVMRLQGLDAALVLTSVIFIMMYAVFTYVDISWDNESMVFLGIAFACIAVDRGDVPSVADTARADTDVLSPPALALQP